MKSKKLMTFIKALRIAYLVLSTSARAIRKLMKALNSITDKEVNNHDEC